MSNTMTEVLPQHKNRRRPTMEWTPTDQPSGPLVGFLTLHVGRDTCEYRVELFPADIGFGVCLTKLTPESGSDKSEDNYCLKVARAGEIGCECKGFVRFGHCKHADAVLAMIENKWL